MNIILKTNLDCYNTSIFVIPSVLPNIGDYISIEDKYNKSMHSNGLFTRLSVVEINHRSSGIEVELAYSDIQSRILSMKNIK